MNKSLTWDNIFGDIIPKKTYRIIQMREKDDELIVYLAGSLPNHLFIAYKECLRSSGFKYNGTGKYWHRKIDYPIQSKLGTKR